MKRITFILIVIVFVGAAKAQINKNDSTGNVASKPIKSDSANSRNAIYSIHDGVYLSFEYNIGNYNGIDLNLNTSSNNYSFKMGYNRQFRTPKSKPKNFSGGIISAIFLGLDAPFDQISSFQLIIGRYYDLNSKQTIRMNVAVGVAYSTIIEPYNWKNIGDGIIGPNYRWDYRDKKTISLIINPKIEFITSNFFGATLSPMLIINKHSSYVGIGFGFMFGAVRKKYGNPFE